MAETSPAQTITSVLQEKRSFPPSPDFSAKAHIKSLADYERLWQEAKDKPELFWARYADELHWFKKWNKVLE